jgi:hypothetical protein
MQIAIDLSYIGPIHSMGAVYAGLAGFPDERSFDAQSQRESTEQAFRNR